MGRIAAPPLMPTAESVVVVGKPGVVVTEKLVPVTPTVNIVEAALVIVGGTSTFRVNVWARRRRRH